MVPLIVCFSAIAVGQKLPQFGRKNFQQAGGDNRPEMGPPVECSGHRFRSHDKACVNCSSCLPNFIVKEKCSPDTDTVCEPLKVAFHDFDFGFLTNDHYGSGSLDKNESIPEYDHMVEQSDMEHWKKLAFSLIGVLCLLVIVATVIVFVTYVRFLKYRRAKTSRQSSSDRGDVEGEYVVIHRRPSGYVPASMEEFTQISNNSSVSPLLDHQSPTTSPRANDRSRLPRHNNYRPQRRLLNEYVDDVFESEDSGGSRSSGIRGHLQTIPETPDGDV